MMHIRKVSIAIRSAAMITLAIFGANLARADPQTLVFADTALISSIKSLGYSEQNFTTQVLDNFLAWDREGKVEPHLARSWEISADGLEYTLFLRDDVTFSDGSPFNAAIAKRNLDRYGLGDKAKGIPANSLFSGYESTDIVDDHTIIIHLKHPNPEFIGTLADVQLAVLGAATLDLPDYDSQVQLKNIIGTGPYVLESYIPEEKIVLTRRDDYKWIPASSAVQGLAQVKSLVFRAIPEIGLRAGAVASHQVDLARGIQPSDEPGLISAGYRIFPAYPLRISANYTVLRALIPQQQAVIGDIRVRTALQLAFDRQALIDAVLSPSYKPATGFWGTVTPGHEDVADKLLQYNPKEANRLLDEAGWTERDTKGFRVKDGRRLSISIAAAASSVAIRPTFDYIETQWRKIGVELINYAGDNTAWTASQDDLKYAGLAVRNQPPQALASLPVRGRLQSDKALAVLTRKALSAQNEDEGARALADWGRYLIEQRYVLLTYEEVQVHAGPANLSLEFNASTTPVFRTAVFQ